MATEPGIFEDGESGYFLSITDTDDRTYALFEDRELQGGGYTWEGILIALVRLKMADSLPSLKMEAEADNLIVLCEERQVLERVAELVRSATDDHTLLLAAMEAAGEELE
jgi:hypothetical protein